MSTEPAAKKIPCPAPRLCDEPRAGAATRYLRPHTSPGHSQPGACGHSRVTKARGQNEKMHCHSPKFKYLTSFLEKWMLHRFLPLHLSKKPQAYWLFTPSKAGSDRVNDPVGDAQRIVIAETHTSREIRMAPGTVLESDCFLWFCFTSGEKTLFNHTLSPFYFTPNNCGDIQGYLHY